MRPREISKYSSTCTGILSITSFMYNQPTSTPASIFPMTINSLLPKTIYSITGKLKLLKTLFFEVKDVTYIDIVLSIFPT